MTSRQIDRLLRALEEARAGRASQEGVEAVLAAFAAARFRDAPRLIRFHDVLLYFCAYPRRPAVLRRARRLLESVAERVQRLTASKADLSPLDDPANSGIAGTSLTTTFSFELLQWLHGRCPGRLRIAWELHEESERLASTLPRFLPLLEEESLADANVSYTEWIDAGRSGGGHRRESRLGWLLRRFGELPRSAAEKAELFDSLSLPVEWTLGRSRWSRTRLRLAGGASFFHRGKLLSRRDVDVETEIAASPGQPLSISRLTASQGERALEAARAALATRYRELYGFTHGQARGALLAEAGRGVRIHLFGLPPERRLPIRAGYAALVTRNGIPVGYGDGFAFFERIDLSFNIFPEFRDGESAFVFAKLLKLYHQALGVTVFAVEPYQIGFRNEEAIASGAFWFYRRLGFRPTSPDLERLAEREESRVAADKDYRSPARVLRRLAARSMLLEIPRPQRREWDDFQIRRLGLAVERQRGRTRGRSRHGAAEETARPPFAGLALLLDLIPDLPRWSSSERGALARILEAKTAPSETRYLRLLQGHARLRAAILALGTEAPHRPPRKAPG